MSGLLGIPLQVWFGQLLLGLINGAFYAILSLGLSIIFGLLNVVNFAHGALYMMGAFTAWLLLHYLGIGYWGALLIAPVVVFFVGIIIERLFLKRIYDLDHLYGLLLTLGLSLLIEGAFREAYGVSGQPYAIPLELRGGQNLGFMFLPIYRGWVILVSLLACFVVWALIEKTRLGSYLRAATEKPQLVQAFGVNVPRMITLTYGLGVALAAFAGVLAAPNYQVGALMGSERMNVVFAVVVIGGMGSILGCIATGLGVGIIEGVTKVVYPEASSTVIFVIMAVVLLLKPAGLFGREIAHVATAGATSAAVKSSLRAGGDAMMRFWSRCGGALLFGCGIVAPFVVYPEFAMKLLCFALFACAFNLTAGFAGLLSFGHAAYFGSAAYVAAHLAKVAAWPVPLAILAATLVAAAMGAVFGWLAIRRQGIYFAMITLALAQMIYFVALQAPFTHGEDGIQAVPRGTLFGIIDLEDSIVLYYAVFAVFLAGFLFIYRIIHSPFGQVLKAIRENEPRAISLGYDSGRYKLVAFTLSAALAGLAGATKTFVFQLASLTDVHFQTSGDVVLMTILGGIGTVFGPVIGAALIVAIQTYFAETGAWVTIITGAIFVVCVLTFRRGIVGEGSIYLARRWGAAAPAPEEPAVEARRSPA